MQVASATSTFSMLFSSSMSVVQYYYLDRFPVPYGKYFASYFVANLTSTMVKLVGYWLLILFFKLCCSFILCFGCNHSCFCWPTCCEKDNRNPWSCIHYHLHISINHFHKCNQFRYLLGFLIGNSY